MLWYLMHASKNIKSDTVIICPMEYLVELNHFRQPIRISGQASLMNVLGSVSQNYKLDIKPSQMDWIEEK